MKEAPAENKIEQSIELGHNNYLYIFFFIVFSQKPNFFFVTCTTKSFRLKLRADAFPPKSLTHIPTSYFWVCKALDNGQGGSPIVYFINFLHGFSVIQLKVQTNKFAGKKCMLLSKKLLPQLVQLNIKASIIEGCWFESARNSYILSLIFLTFCIHPYWRLLVRIL